MSCFEPIIAYKPTISSLIMDSKSYYKSKKISFKFSKNREKIEIPCGHCIGCRLDHANMWATRIMVEAKDWEKCCVVSLTYNDKNLPHAKNGKNTFHKKDLQDFMKRLRYYKDGIEEWINPKNGKQEKPIRYFACGEYGMSGTRKQNGGNPHFHIIFFNWIPEDLKLYKLNKHGDQIFKSKKLQEIWGNGFCTVEELNYNTACYVARYVQKKAGIAPKKRIYSGKWEYIDKIDERNGNIFKTIRNIQAEKNNELPEDEFIEMSRGVGIGYNYWVKNKENIKKNEGILLKINGTVKLKQIPRYYKKQWEKENMEEFYTYKYHAKTKAEKYKDEIIKKLSLPETMDKNQKWEWYLKSQKKLLLNKVKYLKRENFT